MAVSYMYKFGHVCTASLLSRELPTLTGKMYWLRSVCPLRSTTFLTNEMRAKVILDFMRTTRKCTRRLWW